MKIEINEKLAKEIQNYILTHEKDNSEEWCLIDTINELITKNKIDWEQYCEDLASRID